MLRSKVLTAAGLAMLCLSVILGSLGVNSANAAQTAAVGPGNALKVSPVRLDVKMDPGTVQTITVTVQNLTSARAILRAAINDFVASGDESGRPNIILNDNEYAPSHSLKRLVEPIDDFSLDAGGVREIKVTISVPKDAAGGGYYGAVRLAPTNGDGDKNVNLSASLGTLVLLKVNGDIKEDLSVESLDVRKKGGKPATFFMDKKDLMAVLRLKNSGNVQVEPFGNIVLKRFSKTVADYKVNDQDVRSSVLPDSVRRFDVALDKVGAFGKYTLEGNFGYGETGQLLIARATFYVIPLSIILTGVGIVLLVLFLVFVLPKMVRAYNRRIIRRANRRR